jgi:alpha-ribazole phosphatase/probable phosphoglycerate mutase
MSYQYGQPATRLYLWRHPEVAHHREGRLYGITDVDLSSRGRRQMTEMAQVMSRVPLAAVYCSTLSRSRLTAQEVCRAQADCKEPVAMEELREMELGIWENLTFKQVMDEYPQELKARYEDMADYRVKGGESLRDVEARVMPVIRRITQDLAGKSVCLVGHGAVNRVVLVRLMGMPLANVFRLEQKYAHLNLVDIFPDSNPVIKSLNISAEQAECTRPEDD